MLSISKIMKITFFSVKIIAKIVIGRSESSLLSQPTTWIFVASSRSVSFYTL